MQGGVLSRRQLYDRGVSRGEVRWQVRACRWQRVGSHAIALHTGPLLQEGMWWSAVFAGGPRAFLDGATALVAGGLEHFEISTIRISVPRGAGVRGRRTPTLDLRETRRWKACDVMPTGVPRARPAVAAVRAGLWAVSDRQAALLLTMTVQQGLTTAEEIGRELLRVRRDKRRLFLHRVVLDLVGGVRSLGELDFIEGCRERGIPQPDRQAVLRHKDGQYYLDFRWDHWGVVVEVDGIHHLWAVNAVSDALRQNAVVLTSDRVLRLPLLGLRIAADEFFAQVEEALCAAGWRRSAVA
jgi:hypothetical protein